MRCSRSGRNIRHVHFPQRFVGFLTGFFGFSDHFFNLVFRQFLVGAEDEGFAVAFELGHFLAIAVMGNDMNIFTIAVETDDLKRGV